MRGNHAGVNGFRKAGSQWDLDLQRKMRLRYSLSGPSGGLISLPSTTGSRGLTRVWTKRTRRAMDCGSPRLSRAAAGDGPVATIRHLQANKKATSGKKNH